MFKIDWNRKYTTIAVYACIVIAIAGVILVAGLNIDTILTAAKRIISVLNPIFLGAILAYLLNPLLRLLERRVFGFIERKKPRRRLRRGLALLSTYVVILLVITLFILLIVPQIVGSYNDLISRFSSYISSAINFADRFVKEFPLFNGEYETLFDFIDISAITQKLREFITGSGQLFRDVANYILTHGFNLVSGANTLLLAVILSIYMLASKERLVAQCRKICSAFLSQDKLNRVWDLAIYTDRTFGGFIVGKLVDSLIIGVLSFIVFAIFNMPYYPLIAVIVGVTNVIPYFGPFIGAIPSAFIIFIADPTKFILFCVLIFLIQQLDGNVIGPMILGDTTGLSSLGVVVAITVMGGYFGIVGMFFGVPLFAVVLALLKRFMESRLINRGLSTDTNTYYTDPAAVPTDEEGVIRRAVKQSGEWTKTRFKQLSDRRKASRGQKKKK